MSHFLGRLFFQTVRDRVKKHFKDTNQVKKRLLRHCKILYLPMSVQFLYSFQKFSNAGKCN